MLTIKLRDGSFPQSKSATLAGSNAGRGPQYVAWDRSPEPGPVAWFTDICLHQALADDSGKKVAWLIEPPEISRSHYGFILDHPGLFDYVLTWDKEFLEYLDNGLLCYFGGAWVTARLAPKMRDVSLIASRKRHTDGHKLRHEVAGLYRDRLALFGPEYTPLPGKALALAPYRYSIVIENARRDWWFTEKLIDCFLLGTVPIYWGCDLTGLFDPEGVITFNEPGELGPILDSLGERDYRSRLPAIEANRNQAAAYTCVEDWLYRRYPFLFR